MTHAVSRTALLLALAAAPALANVPALAATDTIGTAGAVNPASTKTPPGGATRVVEIGARVVHKERIVTSANGSVQLLFIDKTSLNIGPNSSIVIDEFVYDPTSGTGKMAVSVVQGVLRFVGGNASHTGGATIKMPSVTLGVRGGVVQAESRNGQDTGVLLFGRAEFSTGTQTQVVRRPGWGIQVGPGGQMSPPQKFNVAALAQVNAQVIPPNSRGGAGQRPTEQAAQQQLGSGTTGPSPQVIAPLQPQNTGDSGQANEPLQLQGSTQQTAFNDTVQNSAQSEASNETTKEVIEQQRQQTTGRQPRYFALNNGGDPALGAPAPYLTAAFVAAGTFRNSKVLGFFPGDNAAGQPRTARALQAGLNITGSGASQASTIYLMTTSFYVSEFTGDYISSGGFRASTRKAANLSAAFAGGAVSSVGSQTFRDDNSTPTGAVFTQNELDNNDSLVQRQANFSGGSGLNPGTYAFTQQATQSEYAGSPAGRPPAELVGWAGGLARTVSLVSGNNVGPSFSLFGSVYVGLDDATGRVSGGIAVARDTSSTPSSTADDFQTGLFLLGYQGPGTGSRSAYVDYDNFGAREAGTNTTGPSLSSINGNPVNSNTGLLVTSKTVEAASFFPGVTFCNCEYTRWGFWSSDNFRTSDSGTDSYRDRVHLGTWVAGRYTDGALIPTTGTATFAGHAIGSFKENGNEYVAAGNLAATVDFGARTGSMQISNLDGRSYAGSLFIPSVGSNSNLLFGSLPTVAGPTGQATVAGSFYDGPAGPAREIGGQLSVTGANGYIGSGIFAGSR